ncbi:MAG: phosphatidate cytidylyltransferase [Bacteroidales bacterium]|nr:phosphatidate cytidylyltransferase [Bacteroidales bacterium]MCL2132816.1 phosphatidate cytidylyltransferase [Bacteroidales bacterium]
MKNLFIRTLSGILFLLIMTAGILLHPIAFLCLQLLIVFTMMMEFFRLTWGANNHLTQQMLAIATGLGLILFTAGAINAYIIIPLPLLIFVAQIYQKDEQPFVVVGQNLLAIIYIALPVALWNYFVYPTNAAIVGAEVVFDGHLLLGCFIILWSCDVGAYIFGILFGRHGRHKLFPSLSPKKSWEGFIGGIFSAALAGYLMYLYIFPLNPYHAISLEDVIILSVIICIFGVLGDLVESQFKRSIGVKDSGKIMPGHGGLIDRFDAALLAIPMALFYLKLVNIL